MSEYGDDKWIRRTREVFERGVEDLAPSVRGRLRAARREALQGRARKAGAPWFRWVPAGAGVAAAALVAVALLVQDGLMQEGGPESSVRSADKARDMEILLSGNDLEMYENLEFYAWVSERKRNAG